MASKKSPYSETTGSRPSSRRGSSSSSSSLSSSSHTPPFSPPPFSPFPAAGGAAVSRGYVKEEGRGGGRGGGKETGAQEVFSMKLGDLEIKIKDHVREAFLTRTLDGKEWLGGAKFKLTDGTFNSFRVAEYIYPPLFVDPGAFWGSKIVKCPAR